MTGTKFIQINVNYYAKRTHLSTILYTRAIQPDNDIICALSRDNEHDSNNACVPAGHYISPRAMARDTVIDLVPA